MPKSERSGQVTFKGWILSGCKEEVLVNFSDTSQLHLYIYQQNICRKINNSARPCISQVLHAKHEVCSCSENKTGASFFHLSNLKCFSFFLYCRISKISTRCVTPSCHCHRSWHRVYGCPDFIRHQRQDVSHWGLLIFRLPTLLFLTQIAERTSRSNFGPLG